MTTPLVASIEAEYRRYKTLGERAIDQLTDSQLADATGTSNSIATIVWHLAGNLKSRFTDFLTSDGEKPWRDRDSEFLPRHVTRAELRAEWEDGWRVVFAALADLTDADLARTVTIRGQPHTVAEALQRSVAHASYHVGQIVYVAKALRGAEWQYLSIPPGQSAQFNQTPTPRTGKSPTSSQ
ncbi:MAG TPA: DinB family protein [Steroidobacteraceae bacterium]|nr:DinB family protein [Steroidobacteraceae bacterium]